MGLLDTEVWIASLRTKNREILSARGHLLGLGAVRLISVVSHNDSQSFLGVTVYTIWIYMVISQLMGAITNLPRS